MGQGSAMEPSRPELRDELLEMAHEDVEVRDELAADGSLFEGYHPRMEAVHRRNAARLAQILDKVGWPGPELVGDEAAHAAWLILQHSIGDPPLQRRGLGLLREAAGRGEAPQVEVAMLEDRIRSLEGRGQLYGTQFDWDEQGQMSPMPLVDPEGVDERRRAIGLGPLDEDVRKRRAAISRNTERVPKDLAARRREMEAWFREVGWRT